MRSLNKNRRQLNYALYKGEKPILDEYGNETGESEPIYGEPVTLYCNVSAATGEEAIQAFGGFSGYSRTMLVSDTKCPIDENTIVWFGGGAGSFLGSALLDVSPLGGGPHNYVVVRKADSKNGILYALQEVKVRA